MDTTEWPTIVITATAILYLAAAGVAFLRRLYRPRAAVTMTVYALIASGWAIAQVLWVVPQQPEIVWTLPAGPLERIALYGLPLLAIVFLFLSRAFLHAQDSSRIWWVLAIVWVGLAVLLEAYLWPYGRVLAAYIPAVSAWVTPGALQIITLVTCALGWAIFTVGAIQVTWRQLRPGSASRYQIAATYWVLVILLTVVGDILIFANLLIPGNLLHLAGALLAVTIVVQPRLASIGHLLRHSLSYIVYLAAALVIYAIGLALLLLVLRDRSGMSLILNGLVLALAVLLLFNPLTGRLREEIKLWITGDEQDPTYIMRQYSQTITNILDLKLLASVAVGTASEFLEVNRGSLFLVELERGSDGDNYYQLHGVRATGGENPEPFRLREQCALATALREEQLPITQSDIDFQSRFKDITPDERAWLSSLDAEVYVPIFAKNEWIGLLTLGPKASGGAYSEHDLYLLSTMSDQTAVALENTRLVEGLVRLNAEFRRAYTALDQANRHLERLDRTKSDFISIASHELRTPLTLIRGSSQMLLDEPALKDDPYYSQLLSKIDKGTDRLHEIIDSLLVVAKIDTRALELETQAILPHELINAVSNELKPFAIERQLTIETENLEGLPPITADNTALHKAFYHLLINAIKYTPDGGVITISGREVRTEESKIGMDSVEIVIGDTGIGIDPQYQELIFDKFYQTGELALHSSGKTKFKGGGPGLGLAIVRGIVEAHHGQVWAESPGYDEQKCPGSQFHVLLPTHLEDIEVPMPGKPAAG